MKVTDGSEQDCSWVNRLASLLDTWSRDQGIADVSKCEQFQEGRITTDYCFNFESRGRWKLAHGNDFKIVMKMTFSGE